MNFSNNIFKNCNLKKNDIVLIIHLTIDLKVKYI